MTVYCATPILGYDSARGWSETDDKSEKSLGCRRCRDEKFIDVITRSVSIVVCLVACGIKGDWSDVRGRRSPIESPTGAIVLANKRARGSVLDVLTSTTWTCVVQYLRESIKSPEVTCLSRLKYRAQLTRSPKRILV